MGKIESASFYIPGVVEKGTGNNYQTAINGPCTLCLYIVCILSGCNLFCKGRVQRTSMSS